MKSVSSEAEGTMKAVADAFKLQMALGSTSTDIILYIKMYFIGG
jgi:hypothetical protein